MKKYIKFIIILTMFVSLMVPVLAEQNTLYKFVNKGNGTYGYDQTIPVKLHKFTSEGVEIPAELTTNKYQFRSAWIATIGNLNIKNTTSQDEFKTEYNQILDTYEEWNMNALIFQVRPLLDAFYPSQINPWSEFVTGQSNGSNIVGQQGIDPGWDPLAWMVEETHKRGLEYHAWFNPYRVTNTKYSTASWLTRLGKTKAEVDAMSNEELVAALNAVGILADNNYAVLNPGHVYRFEEKLYLDPGIPAVREHIIETIKEVITNYDVDAIHFDDYFYPYRVDNIYFGDAGEDRETFETFGTGYPDTVEGIEAWRRDNVTALVAGVKAAIDEENQANHKAIQFGISPFGIWEHKEYNALGSNTPTSSSETYSKSIYADTYKWVKEEMIDYISPQIYWSFDQEAAPYGELAKWWSSVVEGTHVDLYIGHANYKHVNNGGWEAAWMNPEEVLNQLKFNQLYPQITGSIFFSYNDIIKSDLSVLTDPKYKAKNDAIDLLKEEYNKYQTIIPAKTWIDNIAPEAPTAVTRVTDNEISWCDSEDNDSRYYVVYRVLTPSDGTVDVVQATSEPRNIVQKVWREGDTQSFIDNVDSAADYTYIVVALDAAHNESTPVIAQVEEVTEPTPTPEPKPELKPEIKSTDKTTSNPKTGYNDWCEVYISLILLSVGSSMIIIKRKREIRE